MRISRSLIVVTSTALLLTACGSSVTAPETSTSSAAKAVTISNCGRELSFDKAPEALVGMHPAQTELLIRLGLTEKIVGQAQAKAQALPDDVVDKAKSIPTIGGVMPPSREELLAVKPDFVYSPTTYEFSAKQGFASIEQLKEAGAAAYVATGGCEDRRMTGEVSDLFIDLTNLGTIFGVQEEAQKMIDKDKAELEGVEKALKDQKKLRVAQIYMEGDALQAIGAGIEYDILKRAGADNVFTPDQKNFSDFFASTLTPEALAAENPEAIVFAAYDADHEKSTRDYLTKTFPDMPAVRENRIISVSTSDMFPGTQGNVKAVKHIASQLYPGAFK